jgi:hypothetical protein
LEIRDTAQRGEAAAKGPRAGPFGKSSRLATIPGDTDRLEVCVTVAVPRCTRCGIGRTFVLARPEGRLHVPDMQSHELLHEVFHEASPKQVASDLGLSLSLIYKWAEPPEEGTGSGAANPLDRIETLLRSTNDTRIVQWICQRAGGFFIKNPKTMAPHPDFLIPATNQIVQEFADLLAVIATAAADNQINKREAQSIRARWEELKEVTEGFVRCCEEGSFAPLHEKQELKPPK